MHEKRKIIEIIKSINIVIEMFQGYNVQSIKIQSEEASQQIYLSN